MISHAQSHESCTWLQYGDEMIVDLIHVESRSRLNSSVVKLTNDSIFCSKVLTFLERQQPARFPTDVESCSEDLLVGMTLLVPQCPPPVSVSVVTSTVCSSSTNNYHKFSDEKCYEKSLIFRSRRRVLANLKKKK